jgi:hypothetical protein
VLVCFLAGGHPLKVLSSATHSKSMGIARYRRTTIESVHVDGLEGHSALGHDPTMLGRGAHAGECFPEVPCCVNGSATMVKRPIVEYLSDFLAVR